MTTHVSKFATTFCMISALLMLPSCDWSKKTSGTASMSGAPAEEKDVLLTINGQPALTIQEFEIYYEQLVEQQPQLKSFAAFMPDLKLNIYATLVSQKALEQWIKSEGIDQKPEYQTDKKMLLENVDRGLAIKYFQEQHPVNISDSDVKSFYDKNKDTVYVMSPSGVNAVGVSLDQEGAAKAFLTKAQQPGSDLNKVATDAHLTARSFGRVNMETQNVDKGLKDKILAMKSFPSTQMFKVDKTYWVVQAKSKDDAKYYPYDQAKEDAKNRIEQERMGEMFNTEIDKLKKQYNIVENKSYFETKQEGPASPITAQADTQPAPKTVAKA